MRDSRVAPSLLRVDRNTSSPVAFVDTRLSGRIGFPSVKIRPQGETGRKPTAVDHEAETLSNSYPSYRMSILRAFALVLCALPSLAAAQSPVLSLVPARIDAVFKDYGPATPGCAVGVYSKGKVLYAKGYGMADLNLNVPITPQTVFDIGSTSKQFAAAAIVLLANEGRLSLSDDVRKHIPELPKYGKVITIDHMLRHTSGLRDYNGLLYLGGHFFEDFTGDDDALAIIVAQRALNFTPGTKWDYSNSGFFLLSVIVQKVTGQSLGDFAAARFFGPLHMPITHFRTDHTAILRNRATAYSPGAKKGSFVIDMSDWDQAGDGAVNTNVLELARWDANFYDAKVGGRALIDLLQERGMLDNGDTLQYARGLFVDTYRGLRRVHHGGAWAGYRAMLMRFPDQRVSVGLTCNVGDADTQARSEAVADVVLARAFREPKGGARQAVGTSAPAAAFDAAPFVGTYFSEEEQGVLSVDDVERKAVLRVAGLALPLESAGAERLSARGGAIALDFSDARQVLTLTMLARASGTYRRVARATPTEADMAGIVGLYYSEELGTTWTVRIEGGKVLVKGRAVGENAISPVIRDGYESPAGFVTFTRGSDGRVNGFDVSASRMKNIHFDKRM